MNSDGMCERSDSSFKAAAPDLCHLSIHRVVYSRTSGALSGGLLFISILLNATTSLEEINRFGSILIFSY